MSIPLNVLPGVEAFADEINRMEAIERGRFLRVKGKIKRRATRPNGYAAPPGTGPAGETCKSCKHYGGVRMNRAYRKCELMRPHWTHGPGSDILAKSPACRLWEKSDGNEQA